MEVFLAIPVGILLAYANGANDNFKGVATLFGSGTTTYRGALFWATLTTLAGSATALFLAQGLLAAFSGKGLVSAELVSDARFPLAVALGAGPTVLLATRLGFPISTTHALIGGLIGAGMAAVGASVNYAQLGQGFLLPLLSSPILAVLAALLVYPLMSRLRQRLGVAQETCICVGNEWTPISQPGAASALQASQVTSVSIDSSEACQIRYQGRFFGIDARPTVNFAHYLSAGAVCFARGLNDTPKIAALLLVGGALMPNTAILCVALAIAIGGILSARRVAETMSHRITSMNPGQGFVANIITSFLVIGASKFGLPVSTTHVSCGSLFGIGLSSRQVKWSVVKEILLAWLITIPLAAALAAIAMTLL